jgi:hypothetical protein
MVERLMSGCKELLFRDGFTQFRDTTVLGSGAEEIQNREKKKSP